VFWRYRARNFPQSLNDEEQAAWHEHCRGRLHDGEGKARTLTSYFEEIQKLEVGLEANLDMAYEVGVAGKSILARLREYGETLSDGLA
jgi:exodeoxyribonuclease-1